MSIISKIVKGSKLEVLGLALACLALFFAACDFEGPWSYYPEETEIYTGIYTYGYIVEGEAPYVCFSKVYELREAAAENFAFYDSAYVSVKGKFGVDDGEEEKELVLRPQNGKPNCFAPDFIGEDKGISGETYSMKAVFKWDSAGHMRKTEYRADATIPTGFGLKGVNVPQKDGSYKWRDVDLDDYGVSDGDKRFQVDFLEFPNDVNFFVFTTKYNESVAGAELFIEYDVKNGGESMKTTLNHMLKSLLEPDSVGYTGISVHDALESRTNGTFYENTSVRGINNLDSIFLPNLSFALGDVNLHFFATDEGYRKYQNNVMAAFDDPRIVPVSNIENGLGVFSGMVHFVLPMHFSGKGISYSYIAVKNCITGTDGDKGWDTKSCRLYQDVYCSGASEDFSGDEGELYRLNETAPAYFPHGDPKKLENDFCYAPAIKAAMTLDSSKWTVFLPKDIPEDKKNRAYGDALKRYCVASNFKSNKIADCSEMEAQCLEDMGKNSCKTYLWEWCSDRNWNMEKFPQCKSGFVSRYYLENQKSSILKREVDNICNHGPVGETIKQCERE